MAMVEVVLRGVVWTRWPLDDVGCRQLAPHGRGMSRADKGALNEVAIVDEVGAPRRRGAALTM